MFWVLYFCVLYFVFCFSLLLGNSVSFILLATQHQDPAPIDRMCYLSVFILSPDMNAVRLKTSNPSNMPRTMHYPIWCSNNLQAKDNLNGRWVEGTPKATGAPATYSLSICRFRKVMFSKIIMSFNIDRHFGELCVHVIKWSMSMVHGWFEAESQFHARLKNLGCGTNNLFTISFHGLTGRWGF